MKFRLKTFPDFGLLAIRVALGLSYAFVHGWQKLISGPVLWTKIGASVSHLGINFAFPMWGFLAMCSEFFGGILILLGLFFRPAAMFIIITMFVAAYSTFGKDLGTFAHPIELGVTILGLLFTGPGKYSLDNLLFGRK